MISIEPVYESKRLGVKMQKVSGTEDEMEKAGIIPFEGEDYERYTNKRNVKRVGVRGTVADMRVNVELAEKWNEATKPKDPESMLEWMDQRPEEADVLIAYLEEWPPKRRFTANAVRMILGVRTKPANLVVHLMFKDKWINAGAHLTDEGFERMKEWTAMQKILAAPSKVKRKKVK